MKKGPHCVRARGLCETIGTFYQIGETMTERSEDFIEAEVVGGAHDGQTFQCPDDQTCVRFWDGPVPFDYYKLNNAPKFYSTDHPYIRGLATKRGRR